MAPYFPNNIIGYLAKSHLIDKVVPFLARLLVSFFVPVSIFLWGSSEVRPMRHPKSPVKFLRSILIIIRKGSFLQTGTMIVDCCFNFVSRISIVSCIANYFRVVREKPSTLSNNFPLMYTHLLIHLNYVIYQLIRHDFFSLRENAKNLASRDRIAMSIHCNYGWYVGCYECRRMDK